MLVQDGAFIVDEDLVAHSNRERFANAFAASFLLPEDEVRKQIGAGSPDVKTLGRLLDTYSTSYETLIYRLHNLRIINAAGRNKLRSLGLRGLVSQLDDQSLATRLLGRMGKNPSRHSPSLLAERAFAGYRRGVISSRPLAGLLGVSANIIAAAMELDAAALLNDAVSHVDSVSDTDSDLYDGSPID